jgi:hypothetical protein
MDAFVRELTDRLPLATAVLEVFAYAFPEQAINELYDKHRGRSYTDELKFADLLSLTSDALLQHGGSGHRVCQEAKRQGTLPVDQSNFYRKLGRMPVAVSRALLRECTVRLTELIPPQRGLLPGCFADFEVVVLDGKKIKNAAKRLKPTRGYSGALIGAKALVAMSLRTGLALAMSDSMDGEANDVPLVPELLPQVREVVGRPILWMADRQFGDGCTPRLLTSRPGDHFLLRVRAGLSFQADPSVPTLSRTEEQGREVLDEIGIFGQGKMALPVRRVTLRRGDGEDDVVLITDLMEREVFDALDLLKLYRKRWGIEQMFQQVTETFSLEHLIGATPKAVLFQMAFCLLMYNLIQVVKAYVAEDGKVDRAMVSTANLFYDIKRELQTWSYFKAALPAEVDQNAASMQRRLRRLLAGSWDPIAYRKAVDKRPRRKRPKPRSLYGGHTSVQRLLEGRVKIRLSKS